jgi:hypothetical protein
VPAPPKQESHKSQAATDSGLIQNGSFEDGVAPWLINVRTGGGSIFLDSSTSFDGAYSAQIHVDEASADGSWITQLQQVGLALTAGQAVTVGFSAKAEAPRPIDWVLQRNSPPWTTYGGTMIPLGTDWTKYSFTVTPDESPPDAFFAINLADAAGHVWVDTVSVTIEPRPACMPTSCSAHGAKCGALPDGCGGTLDCGSCAAPQTCGGGGTPNVCGSAPPAPPPPVQHLAPPTGYTSARLIFDETFSGTTLDPTRWNTFLGSKGWAHWYPDCNGSAQSSTDMADYDQATQVGVQDGLILTATAGSSCAGWSWTSGMISTYGKFEFTGGYVQAAMQAPSGSGLWPAIWMLPGAGASTPGDSFEIDIQGGGFTGNGVGTNSNQAWSLHDSAGIHCEGVANVVVDLTAGYHVYGLEWIPTQRITWFLDGKQVAQVTSAQCTIPNVPMDLILSLGVGTSATSPWHSVVDATTPSPAMMYVREVQVFQ